MLVVDDEPGIRSGVSRIMRSHVVSYPFMEEDFAFEIFEAETGEKALEIIPDQKIDIVLLDNKLPGMDGIEVLEHIKNNNWDVLVMMITSYASLDLAVKATDFGAYNFVPKPFTPQELRTAVDAISKHLFLTRLSKELSHDEKNVRFQFLSVLSHELKSPLNAVEGYLNIMNDRQVGKDLDAYQNMIDRSLERLRGMRTLIMDLLDLNRIEAGNKQAGHARINLKELLPISIDTVEPMSMQKQVKINLHTDDVFVEASRQDMLMILNNLISNAIKYNKSGGEVDVTIHRNKDKAEIIVSDTGIGMSENELNELFKEFVRIRNEKTKNISGTGLGLSIVKKITELYNGEVEVESVPDKGSVFKILLPAA